VAEETGNELTRFLLSAKEAAALLGIGERFLWAMHDTGELGPLPIKLGRRTLWSRFELERWVRARCPRREVWVRMKEMEDAAV
jgi:predicted DNA-binding transcriptional regulator AlpA